MNPGYEFHAIKTVILKILDKAILWSYSDNSFNMSSSQALNQKKNKPNMSSKLCRVIQSLVARYKRHLKVMTLNKATDAENPAPWSRKHSPNLGT